MLNGFTLLILTAVLAGISVPLWNAWKWQGGWKIAAAIPAAVVAFDVLLIVIDTQRDPTSHNLWPFEILVCTAAAFACLAALKVARRVLRVQA